MYIIKLAPETDGITAENVPPANSLNIYPNPFNSTCRIEAPNGSTVEIFDLLGNVVIEKKTVSNDTFLWHPDQTISCGVFLVKITKGNDTQTKKIIYLK